MEVAGEVEGLLKLYSDGSIERFQRPTPPVSSQFTDGVASKDVVINPETGVWARIFKPETAAEKPPLLIYFHGGGFVACSTAWIEYHTFFHNLCKTAGIVVVSVDYRLAPEHRLPAAYDDCTEGVEWIVKQAAGRAESPEEWLSLSAVDFNRCYFGGESAGANIVYHIGLRIADVDLSPVMVKGLITIHPFFGGEEMVETEKTTAGLKFADTTNLIWSLVLPVGSTRDHPFCNPAVSTLNADLKLPPVLVAVAGKDVLKERGEMFYKYLKSCGKEAKLVVEESGIHAYHVILPHYDGTLRLIHTISDFINGL